LRVDGLRDVDDYGLSVEVGRNLPLVSVVTPVFNDEEYLAECLESIRSQTYPAWEYTIVDNASTDSSPAIAEDFAARDPRIRLLRFDQHVDATENHNRALDAISPESEFCKVVQADDWLYPHCLETMVEAASISERVGIVGAYQLTNERVHLDGLPYTTTFLPGAEMLRNTLTGLNVTGGPTAHLLRSAAVRERRPFYQDGFRHMDTEAVCWVLSRYDFAFVHQVLTFARQRGDSRTSWSSRMNTHVPEHIVFLLRYGRGVLAEDEFRERLRSELRSYVRWHMRQFPRISRFLDREFFVLHRLERKHILEAGGDLPEVRKAMALVAAMLVRGEVSPRRSGRVAPGGDSLYADG
jgi:glycosyltransferase involved in cell wall biosynthesis